MSEDTTPVATRSPTTLPEVFDLSLGQHPNRIAIDVPPSGSRVRRTSLSYAQLDARTESILNSLLRKIEGDGIVAMLMPRSNPDLFAAELAVLRAGGAYLALEPSYPDARIGELVQDAAPNVCIADLEGAARLTRLGVESDRVIVLSVDDSSNAVDLQLDSNRVPSQRKLPSPDDLAYVIYTSGTTGRPKGVLIEHRSIVNLVESDRTHFELAPGDRVAQGSSHAYDSSLEETWLAFAAGATVVVMDDETVRLGPDLAPWLRLERITVLCPPPTLLRTLGLDDPQSFLPDLKLLYVGGEALPRDVADAWSRGRRLVNGYGPTECTVTTLRADVVEDHAITIGVPVAGTTAHVLDSDQQTRNVGEEGELAIGGIGLARGYLNRDAVTEARFPHHPTIGRIYLTGDRVKQDASGAFHYLGRIDAQVKVRGHRIELEEVESHLAALPGVRSAAACVRKVGTNNVLFGYVVAANADDVLKTNAMNVRLTELVPAPLVPSRIIQLDELPSLPSGKLDRASLPDALTEKATTKEPMSELESLVATALAASMEQSTVGRRDDFFFDLGGNSVGAALAISQLRKNPQTSRLTVRDIYKLRTVEALAQQLGTSEAPAETPAPASPRVRGHPYLVAACQGLWLLAETAIVAVVLFVILYFALPYALASVGLLPTLLGLPFLGLLAFAIYTPLSVIFLALAKRLLIGSYVPRRVPVWSGAFLRHWIVAHLARFVPWNALAETMFLSTALRALGARVGDRVHIHRGVDLRSGGWDLLTIGDDVSIGRDASLRLVDLDRGALVFGPVTLGNNSVLETRAGVDAHARIEERGHLTALSWLPAGMSIPAGERWLGVPAEKINALEAPKQPEGPAPLPAISHGMATLLARFVFATLVYYAPFLMLVAALPSMDSKYVLNGLFGGTGDGRFFGALASLLVGSMLISLAMSAMAIRCLARRRSNPVWNLSFARIRDRLASDAVAAAGRLLSGSLFWPTWLRLAGMKIGRRSEISTITDVVPSSIRLGSECFLADGIYLGGARVRQGVVEHESTVLGHNTFLGNHVVVPQGTSLPNDVLLGVATPADNEIMKERSSWFGHPSFELPQREIVASDRSLTHEPSIARFAIRLGFESLRFVLVLPPLFILLTWLHVFAHLVARAPTFTVFVIALTLSILLAAVSLCMLTLALKWLLIGRVTPGQHALWSCWCSRWDLVYVCWNAWTRGILSAFEGTLFLAWFLRAMGMRIGKRVVLGSGFAQVVDPDMISIGDDATVSGHFQAHTFEDRMLKIDRVHIGKGATVRDGAILFYGAEIGDDACVLPQSVVMKRERLSPGLFYAGCPTASVPVPREGDRS